MHCHCQIFWNLRHMKWKAEFTYNLTVSGRETPSKAQNWALVQHLEMNCPRRHVLTKQEILLGRAPWWRAVGWGNPGEQLCRLARSLRFYGDGISFRVVFGQSFWFRVFPGGARIAQPRWMLARGILGSGRTRGVSFQPFPNSCGWW